MEEEEVTIIIVHLVHFVMSKVIDLGHPYNGLAGQGNITSQFVKAEAEKEKLRKRRLLIGINNFLV